MVKIPFTLPGLWTLLTLELSRNGVDRLELGLDAFIRLRLRLDLCKVPISVHALLLVKNRLFVGSQNAFNIPIYTYIIFTYYNLLYIYMYIYVITYMICRYIRDSTQPNPLQYDTWCLFVKGTAFRLETPEVQSWIKGTWLPLHFTSTLCSVDWRNMHQVGLSNLEPFPLHDVAVSCCWFVYAKIKLAKMTKERPSTLLVHNK